VCSSEKDDGFLSVVFFCDAAAATGLCDRMPLRKAILVFGLVNAALYAALLPLWEGFDEAFHYSYVETLWQTGHLPELGRTPVVWDVGRSMELAPVSYIVNSWFPETTSFDDWLRLPADERVRRRNELELLRPETRMSWRLNYEAHHPPLAYLCLAIVDRAVSHAPITVRVLVLRLFAGVVAVALFYVGITALCRTLKVPLAFANAALFASFCTQMFYATTAHVANDWLAVGIGALFFATLAEFVRAPEPRVAWRGALLLAGGLLTKAYFLVFGGLAVGAAVVLIGQHRARVKTVLSAAVLALALAGPWYLHNLLVYHGVSGTYEEFDGVGLKESLAVVPRIDWGSATGFLTRGALWTGNNSFTSFSRGTLNLALLFLVISVAACFFRRRLVQAPELVLAAAILLFACAVAYDTCASFADTGGKFNGASPWYTLVLLAPGMALTYLGLSRWGRFGAWLACGMTVLWAWMLMATWVVKLFPMYSGGGAAPMHMQSVWDWYMRGVGTHREDLSLLSLAPAGLLYAGMFVSLALCVALGVGVVRGLAGHRRKEPI
jgi:hypothetical protein